MCAGSCKNMRDIKHWLATTSRGMHLRHQSSRPVLNKYLAIAKRTQQQWPNSGSLQWLCNLNRHILLIPPPPTDPWLIDGTWAYISGTTRSTKAMGSGAKYNIILFVKKDLYPIFSPKTIISITVAATLWCATNGCDCRWGAGVLGKIIC